ncbi:MAG: hypothetical protein LQ339_001189 [Xanthoria mediterranea]|nr:MAG: hypothetical protein LQ339_001189 [Xanthoria mediterranea]
MPTSTAPPRPRVVGLTVVTLVATLALLLTYGYQRPSHVTIGELVVRQPASINISTAEPSVTFSSSPLGNIALPFGRQDHAFHFSPISKWPLVKRVLGPEYQCLVEKGKRYYTDGVLPAFAGVSNFATPPFTQDSFKANGWSVNGPIDEPLPLHWEDAFKLIPEGAPADGDDSDRDNEISRIYVDQSLPFTNAQGSMPPTGAQVYALYIPEACAIITSVSYSPSHELQKQGVPANEIANRIPPLHQLSDILWAVWETLIYAPGNLQYYAVDGITNSIAKPLMDAIFTARRGTINVPWSNRLTFNLDSQEGQTLFASPNGIAVAWFLIHRAQELGRRTPTVTIFNSGGNNRCMIWDLIRQGEPSVFEEPIVDG